MSIVVRSIATPLGRYRLEASEHGLCRLSPWRDGMPDPPSGSDRRALAHVGAAADALQAYFTGAQRDFRDLVLAPQGDPFQQRVWRALLDPFEHAELRRTGAAHRESRSATRAVGLERASIAGR